MIVGILKEIKNRRKPRVHDTGRCRSDEDERSPGAGGKTRRSRQWVRGQRLCRGGGGAGGIAPGDLRTRRHGHARKRAAAFGIRYDPGRTDCFHLPAPGGSRRADPCHDEKRLHRHCVRDDPESRPIPAAIDPHERSGRPHGDPGRSQIPGDAPGRAGGPSWRCARCRTRHGRGYRRRRGWGPMRPRWPAVWAPRYTSWI